jgi:nucleoside 2-deoxyribosyltransferase
MVCGPIGFGGVKWIRNIYKMLRKEGFDVLEHLDAKAMDYSKISDFRKKKSLSSKIVRYDLRFIKKADVIVVLFDKIPSFGSGIEMYVASQLKKQVILFAQKPLPSPWPVKFANHIITSKKELINLLHRLDS